MNLNKFSDVRETLGGHRSTAAGQLCLDLIKLRFNKEIFTFSWSYKAHGLTWFAADGIKTVGLRVGTGPVTPDSLISVNDHERQQEVTRRGALQQEVGLRSSADGGGRSRGVWDDGSEPNGARPTVTERAVFRVASQRLPITSEQTERRTLLLTVGCLVSDHSPVSRISLDCALAVKSEL